MLLAAGPGIRQDTAIDELSLLDVTPILLYSLGVSLPDDLEGRVPAEMVTPEYLASHPVEVESGHSTTRDNQGKAGQQQLYDDEAEAILLARLRELGYVE